MPVRTLPYELIKHDEIVLDETQHKIGRIGYGNFMGENFIYLIDRANLLCLKYAKDGRWIGVIGRRGRGPGEYSEPISIFAEEARERIFIFDVSKFSLICYTARGQFHFEKSFRSGYPYPGELRAINDGYLITFFQYAGRNQWEDIQYFHFLNPDLEIVDEWTLSFPPIYKRFNLYNLASVYWSFHPVTHRLYVAFYAVPEVHVYENGALGEIWQLSLKRFKQIDRAVTVANLAQKVKIFSQYTYLDGLYLLSPDRLLISYHTEELPEIGKFKIFESRKYRQYYFALVDLTNKQLILPPMDRLPGSLLGVRNGQLYLLETDEPNNRRIGVYELHFPS
ncbi:MAG: 6-bladed beta-propeller [Calditrichaeota bacterium]|nr:6-bladed beta-propeller [Calditrichota bacterium]